jgi:acyl carrier protein
VLREFFAGRFPGRRLEEEDDIFALGFANSLFAMQLVEFVESAFAVQIEDDDLDVVNFRSIGGIARLVERKLALVVA